MGELLRLRAGPLSMDFDVQNAFLRYVRFDQFEILRGIFAAVRDQDWNTIPTIALVSHIGCQLEVAVHTSKLKDANWQRCFELLVSQRDIVARLLIFDPCQKSAPATLVRAGVDAADDATGSLPVVAGTNAYFAELNRNRPTVHDSMRGCYSINPQVHAFDNLSLCETLEAQRETVDSAFAIFGCPVVISPITLRPRFNPNATSKSGTQSTPETDARQPTGFAAAWTTGVLGQLATHPRVASLTFYDTWGPRGVMDVSGNSYPISQVFAEYVRSATVFPAVSSKPQKVSAIGLMDAHGQRRVLIGNLSHRPLTVCLDETTRHEIAAESVSVLEMAVTNCKNAACQQVHSTSIERSA